MIERDNDGWPVLKAGMLVRKYGGVECQIIHVPGHKLSLLRGLYLQALAVSVDEWCRSSKADISTDEGKTWHKYEQVTKPESPERIFVNHYEECIPAVHETHDAAVLAAGRDCTDIAREYVRADKVLPWGKGEGKAEERSVVLEIFPSGTVSAWTAQAGYDLTSARNRVYHIPISAILATLPKEGK